MPIEADEKCYVRDGGDWETSSSASLDIDRRKQF